MEILYYICDVFTDQRFGGNQLAVVPDARGLSDVQMQQIAREFNFSETTFVLPPEKGGTCRVRIFTPTRELAFAGHPNIGTAFVLAMTNPAHQAACEFEFEEIAGLVTVSLDRSGAVLFCELKAPQPLIISGEVPLNQVAEALTIPPSRILTSRHLPQVCSVGMPFVIVELESEEVLNGIRINAHTFREIEKQEHSGAIHVYVAASGESTFNTRMFAPLHGVGEDPATGGANCALAGLLAACDDATDKDFAFTFSQGIAMGRPSVLKAKARKVNNKVTDTWIGGHSIMFSQGSLFVDDNL